MRDIGETVTPPAVEGRATIEVRPAAASTTGYVILDDGTPIGWVRSAAIGFDGFASAAAASQAAARATPELLAWYRTRWLGEPIPWLEPVEEDRRVECDGEVVGRLVHPDDASLPAAEGFAFEMRLPTGLWIGTCEALCQRLVHAMRADLERADVRRRDARGGQCVPSAG